MRSVPAVVQTLMQSPAMATADLSSLGDPDLRWVAMPPALIEDAWTALACGLV
ncbi:hypothetical protein ACLQ2P_26415 [Actinomadura citrea]|uniref:hypothetical protein n=1 Tax=Actinomadura citrea TaxID=46158 RepID=UPI003CE53C2A